MTLSVAVSTAWVDVSLEYLVHACTATRAVSSVFSSDNGQVKNGFQ